MPYLPMDCIACVIEWVDNPQDLFNLLTVSRDVFLLAARCLYRNPFDLYLSKDNMGKLILFLLSLSPATGKNIDLIRQSNDLPHSGTPLNPQPMLNYLSLVKVVQFQLYSVRDLCSVLRYPNNDIQRQLIWAFVGHRLDEIEELEIEVDDYERYLGNANKMARLRKIWIQIDENRNYKELYDFAEAMTKAIQLHHGPNQLKECHMLPNPFVYGPNPEEKEPKPNEIDLSDIWRVISLLPPPSHYLTLPRPDGSTVSLNHPFDPYVTTIKTMQLPNYQGINISLKIMMKEHPGHSQAQILQRFRSMTSLSIYPETANGNDENLLAWAACEAKNYNHQTGGHQLVPLENLRVDYSCKELESTSNMKILQDGLFGFSGTLKWLEVIYPRYSDGMMIDRLFTIPRPLHRLRKLILKDVTIDRSAWEQVPNIDVLSISFALPRKRLSGTATNESQDGHNTEATTPSPVSVDTAIIEQQPQQQLPEIWFQCPRLAKLKLQDRAAILLDPNSLHFSPHLKELRISGMSILEHMYPNGVFSRQTPDVPRMLHPKRWTWDWSFPVLRILKLWGDLHEFKFSLAILRSCPNLRVITLLHNCSYDRFPLRVKGILDAPLDKNNQLSSFTHNNLLSIDIRGHWDIEVDELACLLQVLPGLKKLAFESAQFDEGFGDQELIEMTKTHPSLRYLFPDIKLTNVDPSTLDLSIEFRHQLQREMLLFVKVIDGENDIASLPERTRIIYGFGYPACLYYILYL